MTDSDRDRLAKAFANLDENPKGWTVYREYADTALAVLAPNRDEVRRVQTLDGALVAAYADNTITIDTEAGQVYRHQSGARIVEFVGPVIACEAYVAGLRRAAELLRGWGKQ